MDANQSLWSATSESPTFPPLMADIEVDVVVVGGGITGLTCALLLADAGRSVALVEARRIGSGVSHRSTAHLTAAVDSRYVAIESDFGKEGARLVARSSGAAIQKVGQLAAALSIPCNFTRRPGFLYTETDRDVEMLVKEHAAAERAGLGVELLPSAPLPFPTKRAVRFPEQAQMHIQRYLGGLAVAAQAKGARIYEGTRVLTIEDGEPCRVHLDSGSTVRAKHVFVATHAPLNRVFLQTKIAAYRSYVLAFSGNAAAADGLFWDTADPYHYFSSHDVDGAPWLIIGGEDHKTGTIAETGSRFDALQAWAKERIPSVESPTFRWSAQVEESVDGLPFIGRNSMSQHVFVATGFGGNGTTFGTIAAMIVTDLVLGRANPWADLYAATRVKPISSASTYLSENIDFPMHLVTDHLHPPEARTLADVLPGEGKTVRVKGERLAVYRDAEGGLHAVSSVCTHLGCVVKFNRAEKTWDCPCHGSRFGIEGEVLDGPATRPLACKKLESVHHESRVIEVSSAVPEASEQGAHDASRKNSA
jgi:glycine/D-amino acid oxidase-like deaminating enzyme/nitrite reductase/ring-hydroxylating ferredoxin subunit